MMEPLIAFDGYSFTYADAEEPALHDVSLTVDEGEYVALLGLNGAGKTTLGLSLNGVVPSMLQGETSGTLRVAGVEPIDYPVREMAKLVGVVFDNPEFQMSQLSAAEEVALGLENLGTPQDEMRGTVHEMLDLVGLLHCADRSPLTLSGGQQQRLAIASVLAMRPRLLFMDEPTSNLDPAGKDEVFGIARWLNQDRGMTVVVAEHEVEVLARYATRVVVLDHGRIVLNGPPRDVLTQVDVLRSLGLRPPQVTEVAHETDCWRGDVPVTTEQAVAEIGRMLAVS